MEIIFLIVGSVFFLLGLYMLYDSMQFRKNSDSVLGTVVGYEKVIRPASRNSGSRIMYYLVVEFTYVNRHRFKGDIGSSAMSYNIGEEVEVMLLNSEPSTARVKRPARLLLGAVFALIGLVAIIVFFNIFIPFIYSAFTF